MMTAAEEQKPSLFIRVIKWLAVPALVGFVFGFAISIAGKTFGWDVGEVLAGATMQSTIDTSSMVALVTGGLLVVVSLIVTAGALFPGYGIKVKMFADRDDWDDQRGLFLLSALGCFAWGAIMVVLALVEPSGLEVGSAMLSALAVLVVMLAYSCWAMVRHFDELWHDLNQAMCTWAFYGALAIGGGWSALAHLNLAPALAPLDWISLLTILSLVGSIIANGQRGMLTEDL